MSDNMNYDPFCPNDDDRILANTNVPDENNIFEEEPVINFTVSEPEEAETVSQPEAETVFQPEAETVSQPEAENVSPAPQQEEEKNVYPQEPGIYMTQKVNAYNKGPEKKNDKSGKKKKGGFWKKLLTSVVLAAVFGLVSGGVFLAVAKIGGEQMDLYHEKPPVIGTIGEDGPPVEHENQDKEEVSTASSEAQYTVAEVAERCMPAMVGITNKSIQEVPNYFGFGSQNYESESSGSGIIIGQTDTELLIATNNHVVAGASVLTVCFVDNELVNAIIKGTDPDNDLAVIAVRISEVKEETLGQIKVIQIGDSDELQVGEQVVAIGNALGYGQSVSAGYVSALNRDVTIDNTTYQLIQTDAAINPGNSGGALLNMQGELIGINESKYADTAVEGMGYAIPVSTATPILSDLMARETRYKVDEENASYMGISCKDISSDFAEMYNVPIGVYVDSVVENGPAATAGLQKGDIITAFDGTKTPSYTELISLLEYYAAGEIVEITYYRTNNGEYTEQKTSIILGSRSEYEAANQETEEQVQEEYSEMPGDRYEGGSDFYGNQGGLDIFEYFFGR